MGVPFTCEGYVPYPNFGVSLLWIHVTTLFDHPPLLSICNQMAVQSLQLECISLQFLTFTMWILNKTGRTTPFYLLSARGPSGCWFFCNDLKWCAQENLGFTALGLRPWFWRQISGFWDHKECVGPKFKADRKALELVLVVALKSLDEIDIVSFSQQIPGHAL